MASYTTIAAAASAELEIKRSRFLAELRPVGDEVAARAEIAAIRAQHPKARHHCTAFVLGPRQEVQRTNDDGEPSGTAGAPMLEALLGAGLSDVVAVVVRYFGGVLLGASGLTRAYRAAVAEAVASATLQHRDLLTLFGLETDYAQVAAIEAEARRRDWRFTATYGSQVEVELAVPAAHTELLRTRLAELSGGRAIPRPRGEVWVNR